MEPITFHSGIAVPLHRSNIDTDQICASQFLKRITKSGYGDALFAQWRTDEHFVLNRTEYQGASVLVAGPSFGTGSSREHAVWALRDYGFRVIIGSSFGDIFRGNAGKQGLLLVSLNEREVREIVDLIAASPGLNIDVDLDSQSISCAGHTYTFEIDAYTRYRLMNGLDDIGVTLQYQAEIQHFEQNRPGWKPRIPVVS